MPPDVPPVISKTYDLQLWLMQQVPKFPRSHRFVLGDRIQAVGLDVLEQLIEAAYSRNKAAILKRANIHLEKLRYLIRMAKDLTFFSIRQYEYVSGLVDEVGRMVGGWHRQQGACCQKPCFNGARSKMRFAAVRGSIIRTMRVARIATGTIPRIRTTISGCVFPAHLTGRVLRCCQSLLM